MKLLLFGGTSEGRTFAEALAGTDKEVSRVESLHVCVATDYGACLLPDDERIFIHHERLDREGMKDLMKREGFDACIDATHPYASLVSENIKEACEELGLKLIRIKRDEASAAASGVEPVWVDSANKAALYLKDTKGNIFISTGSKELAEFKVIDDYAERCYVRVLPTSEVVSACEELGFKTSHLICMQGPFDREINEAMFKSCNAAFLVTKESGSVGGFKEKIDAAYNAGLKVIIIGRPGEASDEGYTLKEVLDMYGLKRSLRKKAYLIGTGCGDGHLTMSAIEALRDCDHIIGAGRMIEGIHALETVKTSDKKTFVSYDKDEIEGYIKDNEPDKVALLYSGDIGFYSGASGIVDRLDGYEIITIPGISSGIYLCDKLMIPWQDVRFLSCHGREVNIKDEIKNHNRLLVLLGREDDAARLCMDLCEEGLDYARVYIGEDLGYKNESIKSGTAREFEDIKTSSLAVMLIMNI